MLEHISEEALQKYKEKSLPPAGVLSVCDHLESCPQCRERLAEISPLDHLFSAFTSELDTATNDAPPHLLPELMVDYVDNQLDDTDLEIADSHLSSCSLCRADLQDLRAFKATLRVPAERVEAPEKPKSLWQRIALLWSQPAWGLAIQAATLATLVFFLVNTFSLKREISDLQSRLGDLRQTNDALQQQVATIPDLRSEVARLGLAEEYSLDGPESTGSHSSDGSGDSEPLNDNNTQVAVKGGLLTGFASLPEVYERLVRNTLLKQQVSRPAFLNELNPKKEVQMGEKEESFPLLEPKGKTIESASPTLRWGALEGATSYSVKVYDSGPKLVAESPELSSATWTLPEPLGRGKIYTWEVTAIKEGKEVFAPAPPAPPARFKVLEQNRYLELTQMKRAYKSHLLMGTLYVKAGLLDEAEREFQALLKENANSGLAKKLLGSVQLLRSQKP